MHDGRERHPITWLATWNSGANKKPTSHRAPLPILVIVTDLDQVSRFIDNYDVILLDQGRTFMFDLDRFAPDEDFGAVYTRLGGRDLTSRVVQDIVCRTLERLKSAYVDPERYDDVPTAEEAVALTAPDLARAERRRLADIVGVQEVGTISDEHVAIIRNLAETHRLGIVSNVWGPSRFFEDNLAQRGILDCFDVRIWSSDHRCVKPSHRLFKHALKLFNVPPDRIVYVGDDPERDVPPSKAMGMGAVWIDNGTRDQPSTIPDFVISDLSELPDA